ncbi:MAG: hypothetical protein JSV80_07520 [Acidobacteriota bacterium]|nr:MAG: hypothetical protein JSV80_07520 [Acidobacteriota bacterium]
MRKLKVQELENRIAPSMGLLTFLNTFFQDITGPLDGPFDVTPDDGVLPDNVQMVRDSFTVSDNIVIGGDDASIANLADRIRSFLQG